MEATSFLAYVKNGKTTSQWRRRWAGLISAVCVAVLQICGCLHWLSSSIPSRVMVVHNFKSHDRGFRGPGFKWSI